MDREEVLEVWSDIECDDSECISEVSEKSESKNEESESSAGESSTDEDLHQDTWREVPGTIKIEHINTQERIHF